jgi:hypothetical protein
VLGKNDLYAENVAFSRVQIPNNPKTNILVAKSLVFPSKSTTITLVIVVGVVWVGPKLWILMYRITVLDLI